ncbi:MAG: hypothetical protein H0Z32_15610 [Bacillaceae bacterium]|nr:hypothetical protein [Bacillaceae bacterium]
MDQKELNKEQQKLDHTIQQIEERKYHVSDLIKRKQAQLKNNTTMTGDDYTLHLSKHELNKLEDVKNKPYFGRIDLTFEDGDQGTYYIGEHGIIDNDLNIVVVDWRRPIAQAFYNFYSGADAIQTINNNDKVFNVEVKQKREYTIEDQKIIKFIQQVAGSDNEENMTVSDQGTTPSIRDEFLKEIIKNSRSTGYLKKIVSTIQREQDIVIRQPIDRNIIIQGVAGSGKSSIALHRLSFLIYNNKNIPPEKFLIIGPNKLFLNSFKGILPDLDLEDISQTTFQDLMLHYLKPYLKNKKLNLSKQQYFEEIVFNNNKNEKQRIQFKGSKELADIIKQYIDGLESHYEKRITPIKIQSNELKFSLTKNDLIKIYKGYSYLPFKQRVEKFINHVENRFNDEFMQFRKEVENVYEASTSLLQKGKEAIEEENYQMALESLEKTFQHVLKQTRKKLNIEFVKWKSKMQLPDILSIYTQILSSDFLSVYKDYIDENIPKLFEQYKLKEITIFDLPPLFYIYLLLYGIGDQDRYQHVVLDEGQDYSFIHYQCLKLISRTVTILGDKEQAIFENYGVTNWNALKEHLFYDDHDQVLDLNISYRSTKEIIEAANQVLKNNDNSFEPITPLNRKGDKIHFDSVSSGSELFKKLVKTIQEWKKKYDRIAFIHKDSDKAYSLYQVLKKEFKNEVAYLDPDKKTEEKQISIITSYNVKGMEFDAVGLININSENFPNESFYAKLLYILLTRAHHSVKIFYQDRPSDLFKGIVKVDERNKSNRLDGIL